MRLAKHLVFEVGNAAGNVLVGANIGLDVKPLVDAREFSLDWEKLLFNHRRDYFAYNITHGLVYIFFREHVLDDVLEHFGEFIECRSFGHALIVRVKNIFANQ